MGIKKFECILRKEDIIPSFGMGAIVGGIDAAFRHAPIVKNASLVGVIVTVSMIARNFLTRLSLLLSCDYKLSNRSINLIPVGTALLTEAATLAGLYALNLLTLQSFTLWAGLSLFNRVFTSGYFLSGASGALFYNP